jgi:hypothetical protein
MRLTFFDAFVPHRAPVDRRGELEQRIRNLRLQMWSSPEDKRELEGMIEAELRQLDRERGGR